MKPIETAEALVKLLFEATIDLEGLGAPLRAVNHHVG
jgi:hypothetical protein